MSVHISSWVWRESEASGTDLLVLLSLADQANDDGICWPSQAKLSERTRLSRATVQRRLAALKDAGIIYVIERDGQSNLYGFSHLRESVTHQEAHKSPHLPQIEAPRNSEADLPRQVRRTCLTDEAQNHQEPSMNRKGARKRATQFPNGFAFDDVRDWTERGRFVLDEEDFEQFRDHHVARGSAFKDWTAAWRTWARNSKKFSRTQPADSGDSYGGAAYGVFQ